MFIVETICSDEACAEPAEATVFSLGQLEALTCDSCGCSLQALSFSEVVEIRLPVAGARLAA